MGAWEKQYKKGMETLANKVTKLTEENNSLKEESKKVKLENRLLLNEVAKLKKAYEQEKALNNPQKDLGKLMNSMFGGLM